MRKQVYVLDEYITSTKNGIGVFISEFLRCLKKMDVDICHIIFNAGQSEISVGLQNGMKTLSIPRFPSGNFFNNWKVVNRIFRLYVQDSPANVFCFNHSPCPELQESLRATHPLSKQIYIIHNFWWTLPLLGDDRLLANMMKNRKRAQSNENYKWILNTVDKEQHMCRIVDAVVCLTEGTHRLLTDIYKINRQKIFLIPNGLKRSECIIAQTDKLKLRKKYYVDENEKVILYVGRLSESKGVDAVLEAFGILLNTFTNVRLVLAGGLLPDFDIAKYASISNKVTYTGHLPRRELKRWYQMADIGVAPSYTEQCSYVGIEMMMHGLPVVSSDGFGLRDMFKDGVNAIVAPIGSRTGKDKPLAGNLAHALAMLLSSDALRDKIGRNARKAYLQHYSSCTMNEGYRQLFNVL